jgi:hypothetical protein
MTNETILAPNQIAKDPIPLNDFLDSARGQSQEDIIVHFLHGGRDPSDSTA